MAIPHYQSFEKRHIGVITYGHRKRWIYLRLSVSMLTSRNSKI